MLVSECWHRDLKDTTYLTNQNVNQPIKSLTNQVAQVANQPANQPTNRSIQWHLELESSNLLLVLMLCLICLSTSPRLWAKPSGCPSLAGFGFQDQSVCDLAPAFWCLFFSGQMRCWKCGVVGQGEPPKKHHYCRFTVKPWEIVEPGLENWALRWNTWTKFRF